MSGVGGVGGSTQSHPLFHPSQILRPLKRQFPFSSPKSPAPSPSIDEGKDTILSLKLASETEYRQAENGESATSQGYKEAVNSPVPVPVSGTGGKRRSRAKMSKHKPSGPQNPESNAGPSTVLNSASSCRYDSSLSLLTKKFINLIQQAEDGTLDLNEAADVLDVQKRRIYDITNVLEGVGLIEKTLKNRICWKGLGMSRPMELDHHLSRLKADVDNLFFEECRIDERIREMQENLRALNEDENNRKWLYVTKEDIKSLPGFQNETVVAIKAPHGTTIEVPDPDEGVDFPHRRYQLLLRSTMGPIGCYLLSGKHEERIGDLNNGPHPAVTGLSVENTSSSNVEGRSLPTIGDAVALSDTGQLRGDPKLCSEDPVSSQDSEGGILNIVPSDGDVGADYWLVSDVGVSMTDMWKT
ncbi:transcription factor E2FB-like [Magnolia sinica]|uniref:transcription factor E2FB-like n=1 Tax=Magnolia sinica TaxID=86752 RepID=UPI002658A2B2|nr:transcription factor E2FB-like [Magnolia sinica]